MRLLTLIIISVLMSVSALFVPVQAQVTIGQEVFGSAGVAAANDNYKLSGTVGQVFTTTSLEAAHSVGEGFWNHGTGRVITHSEEEHAEEVPADFRLYQNYPNPFNPVTVIEFSLPEPADVTLTVYDVLGRKVESLLVDESYSAGIHQVEFDSADLASGIYIYRLQAPGHAQSRKMTVAK